ncbi:MAG: terminase small subunit [Candidatus Heimdallarchaeaceae archaeon]
MAKIGRPKIYTDEKIEHIRLKFEEYIEKEDVPIIAEFSYLHNVNRARLYEFEKINELFSDTIQKCRDKKESQLEKLGLMNIINPTMAIFSLKQLGWRDKQELEHSGTVDNNITILTSEEREKRIEELKKKI